MGPGPPRLDSFWSGIQRVISSASGIPSVRFNKSDETSGISPEDILSHTYGGLSYSSTKTAGFVQSDGVPINDLEKRSKVKCLGLDSLNFEEERESWSWVADQDELITAMRKGSVFFGFIEGPIRVPPSFKWRVEKVAGNFTDVGFLESAYAMGDEGETERASVSLRPPSYTDRILCYSQPDSERMLEYRNMKCVTLSPRRTIDR